MSMWNDYTKILASLAIAAWTIGLGPIFIIVSVGLAMVLACFTVAYAISSDSVDAGVCSRMQTAWFGIAGAFIVGCLIA